MSQRLFIDAATPPSKYEPPVSSLGNIILSQRFDIKRPNTVCTCTERSIFNVKLERFFRSSGEND